LTWKTIHSVRSYPHTDLLKLKVDVANAERIFRKALDVLGAEMPEVGKDCEYCRWAGDLLKAIG